MFSKEESKKLIQEFWTSFGKEYPHKWILYNTKIKDLQLKFTFTTKFAQVSMDIVSQDEIIRAYYFEKLIALKTILKTEYLREAEFNKNYELPEGKAISRVYLQLDNVSIHNKKDWPGVYLFLQAKMQLLEDFFLEHSSFLEA
ncbi:MAG: DUF4268 domain-containing protein [Flavobacteriaceae bacterium]|nr:DUF4268 domain-containing protein [Flavobacteriaceae bacterium]